MSVAEYQVVVEQHMQTWTQAFLSTDPEYVLQQYFQLLLAIASDSPRLGTKELAEAARCVHPNVSEHECMQFAQKMQSVFSGAWKKLSNVTSGKHQSAEMNALLAVMRLHKKRGSSPGLASSPKKAFKGGSSEAIADIAETPGQSSSSTAILPYCDEFARISMLYAGGSIGPFDAPPSDAADLDQAPVAPVAAIADLAPAAPEPEPIIDTGSKPITWTALNEDPPLLFRKSGDSVEKAELVVGPGGSPVERRFANTRGGIVVPPVERRFANTRGIVVPPI